MKTTKSGTFYSNVWNLTSGATVSFSKSLPVIPLYCKTAQPPHIKLQSATFKVSAGASNSAMNWHRPVSCTDDYERNMILNAIEDYHQKTAIRFKQYDPLTDRDYVHITGKDSGCWSYVGRIGGVSNTVQSVVMTSPTLRKAPLAFCSLTPQHTNPHRFITCYIHP